MQTNHTRDPTGSHEDDSATRLKRRGKVPDRKTSRNNAADDGGTAAFDLWGNLQTALCSSLRSKRGKRRGGGISILLVLDIGISL